jgi:hypothetical protein
MDSGEQREHFWRWAPQEALAKTGRAGAEPSRVDTAKVLTESFRSKGKSAGNVTVADQIEESVTFGRV